LTPPAPAPPPAGGAPPVSTSLPTTTTPQTPSSSNLPVPPAAPASVANTQTPGATGALSGGTQIVVAPSSTDLRVGSSGYSVALQAVNASRLSSVSLTMTYNPAALRVRSVQQGSFMSSSGTAVAFTEDHSTPGRIDIVIMRTGDSTGAAGSGLLSSVLFDAVGAGPANINITGAATVPGGGGQTLQFAPVPAIGVR
jgi:hypothetical protein